MNRASNLAIALLAVFTALPALAQQQKDPAIADYGICVAPNSAGRNSTNYYGNGGDPCAFIYNIPGSAWRRFSQMPASVQCAAALRWFVPRS